MVGISISVMPAIHIILTDRKKTLKGIYMTKQNRMFRCILYGAFGDAFGSDLEMITLDEIKEKYGEHGKRELNSEDAITDDTQMTLFTLEGLALSQGKPIDERVQIMYESYLRWFNTQYGPDAIDEKIAHTGELWKIDELYEMRAPGHACIDSLRSGNMGTLDKQFNDSLGNGTVMRSAPFGFLLNESPEYVFELTIRCAAITHGHREAQLSAGLFALLIYHLLRDDCKLIQAEIEAQSDYINCLKNYKLDRIIGQSYTCLINGSRCAGQYEAFGDEKFPHKRFWNELDNTWLAPCALGKAVYYLMRYNIYPVEIIFSHVANNEKDSDTVASITGNLMGANRHYRGSFISSDIIAPYTELIKTYISSISPK